MINLRSTPIPFFLLLFFCFRQIAFAQEPTSNAKIIAQYDSVRTVAPREKIYVHLDKAIFAPQDTLWFKAYLVDATTNVFSKVSGLIYFDMFDANGTLIETICVPTAMGVAWGGIALKPDAYKAGSYTFRAYTNWMQNFGDAYIFKKEIKILDFIKDENVYQLDKKPLPTPRKISARTIEKSKDIDIQFLPEGGNWKADRMQKMAFKAVNYAGKGIEVTGEIFDSKQNKILDFKSNNKGMGYFMMVPILNEAYTATINSTEITKTQNLPKLASSGAFLQVNNSYGSDGLAINVDSDLPEQEITMIGQSKGVACFTAKFISGKKYKTVYVPKSLFPRGICQILLIDGKNRVLNERNFFINRSQDLIIQPSTSTSVYGLRDSICVNIQASDFEKKPISGTFSVAVTDDNQIQKDSLNDNNILSHLLLASDLKGEIESPGYYFNHFDEQKHNDLEALVLTQGWIKYNWELDKRPLFKAEKEFTISGRVTNITNKPAINGQILLLGMKKPISIMETRTDSNGVFIFRDFPVLDSAAFVVQAKNTKGKVGTLGIELNEFQSAPFLMTAKNNLTNYEEPLDSISKQFIAAKNEEYEASFKSGIILREVKITGKKTIKGSKNLNGDGNADITLTEKDLDKVAKKTLGDVLKENIKGLHESVKPKTGFQLYKVNGSIFKMIIDGVEVDYFFTNFDPTSKTEYLQFIKSYFDYYNAEDIKGIEIMTSGKNVNNYIKQYEDPFTVETYVFVEVTTRTGSGPFLRKSSNMFKYNPPAYGDNKEFYSPKYTDQNKGNKKPDYRSTIYWNPHILTNEKGIANFSFFSADKKGFYTVWIEGSDMNGNFGMKALKLEVK